MSSRGRPPAAVEHGVLDALRRRVSAGSPAQRREQLGEVAVAEELASRPARTSVTPSV